MNRFKNNWKRLYEVRRKSCLLAGASGGMGKDIALLFAEEGAKVVAPMKLMRGVIPIMVKQEKGVIVNTSSLGRIHGSRAGAAYTASKHALTGLTKNVAYMYAEKGIRANAICPGGVDTDIMSSLQPNVFGMERIMKGTTNNPRSGSPKEIAKIALFLASDDSSFISGDTIVADA